MPQSTIDTDDLTRIRTGANLSKDRPTLAVRPNRDGYITKAADRKYFADVDHVAVYVDADQGLIALEPVPDKHLGQLPNDEVLGLGRENSLGAVVSLKSAFNALDVPEDRFPVEKSRHYDLQRHDGLLVADVSEILQEAGVLADDGPDGPPVPDAAEEYETAEDDPDEETYNGFDPEKLMELAGEADTLEEYADLLGAPVGIARKVAMDADVYHRLQDNPSGAYRGGATDD